MLFFEFFLGGTAIAYVMIAGAALVRGFGFALLPDHYYLVMYLSAALWIGGFALFCILYAPILLEANPSRQAID